MVRGKVNNGAFILSVSVVYSPVWTIGSVAYKMEAPPMSVSLRRNVVSMSLLVLVFFQPRRVRRTGASMPGRLGLEA